MQISKIEVSRIVNAVRLTNVSDQEREFLMDHGLVFQEMDGDTEIWLQTLDCATTKGNITPFPPIVPQQPAYESCGDLEMRRFQSGFVIWHKQDDQPIAVVEEDQNGNIAAMIYAKGASVDPTFLHMYQGVQAAMPGTSQTGHGKGEPSC